MDVGPLGAGEDRYHLFRIVGRPYALSAKVLAGLNSTQKRQIINGIVGSIYTLHHFMPPLPHRGLRRAATTSAARERTAALCWRCSRR